MTNASIEQELVAGGAEARQTFPDIAQALGQSGLSQSVIVEISERIGELDDAAKLRAGAWLLMLASELGQSQTNGAAISSALASVTPFERHEAALSDALPESTDGEKGDSGKLLAESMVSTSESPMADAIDGQLAPVKAEIDNGKDLPAGKLIESAKTLLEAERRRKFVAKLTGIEDVRDIDATIIDIFIEKIIELHAATYKAKANSPDWQSILLGYLKCENFKYIAARQDKKISAHSADVNVRNFVNRMVNTYYGQAELRSVLNGLINPAAAEVESDLPAETEVGEELNNDNNEHDADNTDTPVAVKPVFPGKSKQPVAKVRSAEQSPRETTVAEAKPDKDDLRKVLQAALKGRGISEAWLAQLRIHLGEQLDGEEVNTRHLVPALLVLQDVVARTVRLQTAAYFGRTHSSSAVKPLTSSDIQILKILVGDKSNGRSPKPYSQIIKDQETLRVLGKKKEELPEYIVSVIKKLAAMGKLNP